MHRFIQRYKVVRNKSKAMSFSMRQRSRKKHCAVKGGLVDLLWGENVSRGSQEEGEQGEHTTHTKRGSTV